MQRVDSLHLRKVVKRKLDIFKGEALRLVLHAPLFQRVQVIEENGWLRPEQVYDHHDHPFFLVCEQFKVKLG